MTRALSSTSHYRAKHAKANSDRSTRQNVAARCKDVAASASAQSLTDTPRQAADA
jgi:hypothetical protein